MDNITNFKVGVISSPCILIDNKRQNLSKYSIEIEQEKDDHHNNNNTIYNK